MLRSRGAEIRWNGVSSGELFGWENHSEASGEWVVAGFFGTPAQFGGIRSDEVESGSGGVRRAASLGPGECGSDTFCSVAADFGKWRRDPEAGSGGSSRWLDGDELRHDSQYRSELELGD